ncbi:MAG: glycosyltransferase [Desulfurococcaceae archaeon]
MSVVVVTYRRGWSLPYSLGSLAAQSRTPDEVVVVLKPSGDGSEDVVDKFRDVLPIRLYVQERGNVTDAYSTAIEKASGDIILFIDDDAVAEEKWVEKYVALFQKLEDAGGIGGVTYRGELQDGEVVKTDVPLYPTSQTKRSLHRKPLPEYSDYCHWISAGGYMGETLCEGEVVKSAILAGVNMGFRKEAVADCPLGRLYWRSRRGLWFEQFLAYCAKKKGYHTYQTRPPTAPLVWHISHYSSLTRGLDFWDEFWRHYDRAVFYWRLRRLGASVSFWRYLVGLVPYMFCERPRYCWELIVRNRSSLYRKLNDMGVLSSDSRSLVDLARFAVKRTAARFLATLYALTTRA